MRYLVRKTKNGKFAILNSTRDYAIIFDNVNPEGNANYEKGNVINFLDYKLVKTSKNEYKNIMNKLEQISSEENTYMTRIWEIVEISYKIARNGVDVDDFWNDYDDAKSHYENVYVNSLDKFLKDYFSN